MAKTTLTAIHYDLPQGVTVHTWADKRRSTLQGDFDRIESHGYVTESYLITAHYDHATGDVCTVVLNACNHSYADSAFKAQREAITRELVDRVAKANPAPCPVCGRTVCLAGDCRTVAADSVTKRICDGVDPFHGRGGVDFPPLPLGAYGNPTGDQLRDLADRLQCAKPDQFDALASALITRLARAGYIAEQGV